MKLEQIQQAIPQSGWINWPVALTGLAMNDDYMAVELWEAGQVPQLSTDEHGSDGDTTSD